VQGVPSLAPRIVTRIAHALAAVFACLLAWRVPSPRQRAIAGALVALLAVDALRPLMPWLVLRVALWATFYAVTAWAVWVVLDKEGPAPDGAPESWAPLALTILAASTIAVRRGITLEFSRSCFVLALAAQLVAGLRFIARGKMPDDAQRVALVLVASSIVDAVPGPWMLGEPVKSWDVGRWISGATWLAIAVWEAVCLIRVRARS
jgi:hypothetical protein